MGTNDRFSNLLWMPHSQHKVSKISENPNNCLNIRHHRVCIPYHQLCRSGLENLGFYQIARMKKINVDKYLISALVERWRPETNSFHLPVGEMTVTLQDVSCLWGLPIHGEPLIGQSDRNWAESIERFLGIPMDEQHMKKKKRKREDDTDVMSSSQYSISLSKLRDRFREVPQDPIQREIHWHTRALVLEIIGSIAFTDTSGDGVPAMYLQFMENLGQPTTYNWGAAVLSMLYRQLSMGAERARSEITGPLLLLQLWSWSRLPLGRPVNIIDKTNRREGGEEQDQEELEYSPVFGAKWCAAHRFSVPHNSGTEYYRNQIDLIREGTVNWQPYEDFMEQMPTQVQNDRAWWFVRLPLFHFWIVEFHYPDRVMRQFGLRQVIPPCVPQCEDEVRRLQKIKHTGGKSRNWERVHAKYIQQYSEARATTVQEDLPFDRTCLVEYRQWFQQNGMYTVFFDSQCLGGLENPIPYPRDNIEWTGYMPSGPPLARIGLRDIKNAAWGIKCAVTIGYKKFGKYILNASVGNLRDLNLEPQLHNMLREAGLPSQIEDIPSDDEVSFVVHPPSPPRDTSLELMDDWINTGRGFTRYLNGTAATGNQEPTAQDASQMTRNVNVEPLVASNNC